jgi:hypothetical protein
VTAGCYGELKLTDAEYRTNAALRLGLVQPFDSVQNPAPGEFRCLKCSRRMDRHGHHAFHCSNQTHAAAPRNFRHNAYGRAIKRFAINDTEAKQRGLVGKLKVPLDGIWARRPGRQGASAIRADITVRHSRNPGDLVALDITIVHPNAVTHPDSKTLKGQGAAAQAAEKAKNKKYSEQHVIPGDKAFVPIALETFGTMGSLGASYLRSLVRDHVRPVEWVLGPDGKTKMVDHGGRYSIFLRRLWELLAVSLARGNHDHIARWHAACVPPRVAEVVGA